MQAISRMTALFLLAGMAALWLGVPALAQPDHSLGSSLANTSLDNLSRDAHSVDNRAKDFAGCHHEGGKTPPAAPVGYRCCIAGHDHAIPSAAFSGVAPLPRIDRANEGNFASPSFAPSISRIVLASSPSPPGLAPLRI
jgi:hypothetical protein